MAPSATRVASRFRVAASERPVPLTAEQKSFLRETAMAMNAELRGKVEGSKPDYSADTTYQSGRSYVKDAYGRKSPLAGVPHALIRIDVTVLKDGSTYRISWSDRAGSPLEFLLSSDGTTVIVKEDSHWGRGTRSPTARQMGTEWAEVILRRLNDATHERQRAEQAKELREVERKQQDAAAERARQEAERMRQEAEATRLREIAISGDGKGYTVRTIVQWENDESDADDDPWEGRQDPATGMTEDNTEAVKTLRDVAKDRYLHTFDQKDVRGGTARFSRSYTRRYNARGIYGLTRTYDEEVIVSRVDRQPFNAAELAYLKDI